jgi:hypothetical protein
MNALPLQKRPKGSYLDFDLALWKDQIQLFASSHDILSYLQPDLDEYDATADPTTKLEPPQRPEIPFPGNRTGSQTTSQHATPQVDTSLQLMLLLQYSADRRHYEELHIATSLLLYHIKSTVTQEVARELSKMETPAAAYHTVLQYFRTNETRIVMHVEMQWHNLFTQSTNYSPLQWLTELETIYKRLNKICPAVIFRAPTLLTYILSQNGWLEAMPAQTLGEDPQFLVLLEKYRDHIARKQSLNARQHAVSQHGKLDGSRPSRSKCICSANHPLKVCWYLNPDTRPARWTPVPAKTALITEALFKNPKRILSAS